MFAIICNIRFSFFLPLTIPYLILYSNSCSRRARLKYDTDLQSARRPSLGKELMQPSSTDLCEYNLR